MERILKCTGLLADTKPRNLSSSPPYIQFWEGLRRHPSRQRTDSPTASTMPIDDQSNHSAAGTLHPHHSTHFCTTATKSPLVTVRCAHLLTKCPFHFGDLHLHLIHPSFDRPHSPPHTASTSNQLFFHNSSTRQTDRTTDKLIG